MSIYQSIYNIIETYLFGTIVAGSHEELVTITLASIATIFVFILPFYIVLKVINIIMGN